MHGLADWRLLTLMLLLLDNMVTILSNVLLLTPVNAESSSYTFFIITLSAWRMLS